MFKFSNGVIAMLAHVVKVLPPRASRNQFVVFVVGSDEGDMYPAQDYERFVDALSKI